MAQRSTGMGMSGAADFAQGAPHEASTLPHPDQSPDLGASQRGSTLVDSAAGGGVQRSDSTMSQSHTLTPSRGGTLKKKRSLSKKGSIKRTGSRRSSYAGSIKGLAAGDASYDGPDDEQMNSAFFTPVPTTGSPTEILSNRFQGMSSSGAWCIVSQLMNHSLAKGPEGSHHLFPRCPEVLRVPFQVPFYSL